MTREVEIGRIYRHSKTGKLYKTIYLAKDAETLDDVVVYEAVYNNDACQFWVRPLAEFLGKVDIRNGEVVEIVPRFKEV